jgi:hypothetical protein
VEDGPPGTSADREQQDIPKVAIVHHDPLSKNQEATMLVYHIASSHVAGKRHIPR